MPYFKDTEELYACLGTLFQWVSIDAAIGPKIQAAKIITQFTYKDPDGQITIDAKTGGEEPGTFFTVHFGETDLVPDVSMSMKADVGHQFWFGKVNLMMAVNRRQIVPKGPMATIFKLLPVIVPTFKIYPKVLEDLGKSELILK